MTDIVSRKEIEILVNEFYTLVRKDELLAPVFAHLDWPHHLPTMYNFWSSVLLGDMSYTGSPFPKHVGLKIDHRHFQQWLTLFNQTVNTHFSGPVAEEAKTRAHTIAQVFTHKLGLMTPQ
ncbi:MAG: group III truncated hemoglobin [Cyclobacteriaceae bacterium]